MIRIKKLLIVLVIIASFFTFQSALEKYDELVLDRFTGYDLDGQSFEFAISGELDTGDVSEFQQKFEGLLDKYKINCYQRLYVDNEQILWTYTNDESYLNNIALTEGKLSAINKGDYYFSNDEEKKGTLFNPIRNENFKVYHLSDFSNKHKSIFNPYELVTYEENPELVYYRFVDEFKSLYPNMSVSEFLHDWHGEPISVEYEDIIFALLMSLMVILGLNVLIIKQTKKIQILKLEGYSNWEIYRSQILKYLRLILVFVIATNIVMYCYYIDTSFENTKPFFRYLTMPTFIFVVSLFIFSIISFITISFINVNSAMKGKSSLKNQKNFNYIIKVALIVFTTFIVLNGIDHLKQFYNIMTTEQEYLNNIENLYTASYTKPQYIGMSLETDLEKEEQVKNYLVQENSYFRLSYLEELPIGNSGSTILVCGVSKEYVNLNLSREIAEKLKGDSYVLIPESSADRKDQILEVLRRNMYGGFNGLGEVLTYPDTKLKSIVPYNYLQYGVDVSDAVLFVETSFGIGGGSYFKYDGNAAEVQEYFDKLYADRHSVATVMIEPVEEQYISSKAFFFQEFKTMMPIFIMIILAIFTNTYQMSMLNCEINEKKYAILKSEGSSTFALIFNELRVGILLLLIAETILYIFMDITLGDLVFIIIVYLVMDVLVLWTTTGLKMRRFAEKLR